MHLSSKSVQNSKLLVVKQKYKIFPVNVTFILIKWPIVWGGEPNSHNQPSFLIIKQSLDSSLFSIYNYNTLPQISKSEQLTFYGKPWISKSHFEKRIVHSRTNSPSTLVSCFFLNIARDCILLILGSTGSTWEDIGKKNLKNSAIITLSVQILYNCTHSTSTTCL